MRKKSWFRKTHLVIALVLGLWGLALPAVLLAQDAAVTVPNVVGLGVPEAAAVLNRSGIVLGRENNVGWSVHSDWPQNTISVQSLPAGESVPYGTVVDVTVVRAPNVLLLYDDNDLTLINQSGERLNLDGIEFRSTGGSAESSFPATRWTGALGPHDCGQIWSVSRSGPKDLHECSSSMFWLTTRSQEAHFWTGAYGATQFQVWQQDVERAVCPIANPGRCELYLASAGMHDAVTEYVYFAYTPDRLIVLNPSDNQWMPLHGITIINYAHPVAGSNFAFGDPTVFGNPATIGRIDRLAPGQCLLYTNSDPSTETPPQPCDLVARLDLDPSINFWVQAFGVNSTSDEADHRCAAATVDKVTICIMPR